MKSSFNAFGRSRKEYGSTNIPVWLGTVTPVPRGGVLAREFVFPGAIFPAGTPVYYEAEDRIIVPLPTFYISDYQAGTPYDTIKVKTYGYELSVGQSFRIVGSTFQEEKPSIPVAQVKQIEGGQEIKFEHSYSMEGLHVGGSIISPIDEELMPNGYLYNDICIGDIDTSDEEKEAGIAAATGAVVMFHAEGILIDRTPAAGIAEAMAKAVPHVLQVKG